MIKIEWWCKKKPLVVSCQKLILRAKGRLRSHSQEPFGQFKSSSDKMGTTTTSSNIFQSLQSQFSASVDATRTFLLALREEEEQDRSEIIFRKHKIILAFWEVPVYFKQSIESRESHEGTLIQPLSQSLSISVAPSGLWLCSSHWDDSIQRSVCVSVFYFYVAPEIKNTRNIILLLCYCVFSAFI